MPVMLLGSTGNFQTLWTVVIQHCVAGDCISGVLMVWSNSQEECQYVSVCVCVCVSVCVSVCVCVCVSCPAVLW